MASPHLYVGTTVFYSTYARYLYRASGRRIAIVLELTMATSKGTCAEEAKGPLPIPGQLKYRMVNGFERAHYPLSMSS